jgi:hypothetical protein
LALRSTASAVAVTEAQADPVSPVASLQAGLRQELASFVMPDKARMEAAMTQLGALHQELSAGHTNKVDASVEELARQLQSQLSARAKSRLAKENLQADLRAEARVKGYEGESCRECGNFTLLRNGTCLKCDTCGGTSGCS